MPAFAVLGRVLFSILFIVSGAYKLSDISGIAQLVSTHVVVPSELSGYSTQIEAATGLPLAQLIVIVSGALEVICGFLIAVNFGTKIFAILLALFIAATVFYFHDFWNMTGADRISNMFQAFKNLSLIGGLLMIVGYPRAVVVASEPRYENI